MAGIFVTGTDTGVGKTAVACGILGAMRERGVRVAGFKPVESGFSGPETAWPNDAAALNAAAGMRLRREEVVPYVLREPLAPAVGAQRESVLLDLKVLDRAYESLAARSQLVVVEGAGGLAVPLLRDPWFTMADLAFTWGLPLVVVCRPGLGTINHTVLTVEYARRKGVSILGLVVNGFPDDPGVAERTNPEVIAAMTGVPLLGVLPKRPDVDIEAGRWQGKGYGGEQFLQDKSLFAADLD
ncbi:MAG: dethiobiotin synthase, partial [Thermoplasmatota archaeon]